MNLGFPFASPERHLSPGEVEQETRRLLALCTEKGVEAVVAEACACRDLLEAVADACFRSGLTSAAQYLSYSALPYD